VPPRGETAQDLRGLIGEAERLVANLRGSGPQAEALLHLLDRIHGLLANLEDTGVDLRAEMARLETVERLLEAKDVVLIGELRRAGGLAATREAAKPVPAQWWWYLDRRVAERRRQQWRRALLIAGGVAAVLFAAWAVYRYVFPPDPRRMAAMDKAGAGEQLLARGDLAGAAASYRQAAEITPEDPSLHIWIGVLEARQRHPQQAALAFARAEQLLADRTSYLVMRGMAWLQVGALDRAQADAEAALAANPDSAEAYLLLGSAFEAQGDARQAIDAFQQSAELAEKAGNSTLVVMARTRLGMLLQAGPVVAPLESATPVR